MRAVEQPVDALERARLAKWIPADGRALSVRNPWGWALCAGLKTGENRSWPLGRFAGSWTLIHVGKAKPTRIDADAVSHVVQALGGRMPAWARLPVGGVIGAVVFDRDIDPPDSDPWAVGPRFWTVRRGSAVLFEEPLPCPGLLGFFDLAHTPAGAELARTAGRLIHEAILARGTPREDEQGAACDGDPTAWSEIDALPVGESGW